MKSLIQYIKTDEPSLIPLEEKLRIGKDWKPDYIQEIIALFDDNFKNMFPNYVDTHGFYMDNTNQIEMYKTIVDAIKKMGTPLARFIKKDDIKKLLERDNTAIVGFYDLIEDDDRVPSGDLFQFSMFHPGGCIDIRLYSRLECIKAVNEYKGTSVELLSHMNKNLYEISGDDFMILVKYIFEHSRLSHDITIQELVNNWNKK